MLVNGGPAPPGGGHMTTDATTGAIHVRDGYWLWDGCLYRVDGFDIYRWDDGAWTPRTRYAHSVMWSDDGEDPVRATPEDVARITGGAA